MLDRWANRSQIVPPELIERIAPTRLEGINSRGVFRFPVERYATQLYRHKVQARQGPVAEIGLRMVRSGMASEG